MTMRRSSRGITRRWSFSVVKTSGVWNSPTFRPHEAPALSRSFGIERNKSVLSEYDSGGASANGEPRRG